MNDRTSHILIFILVFSLIAPIRASKQAATDSLRNDSTTLQKVDLEELVVTSFRYNKNVRNISAPFQIIGKTRIENNAMGELATVLNSVPGLQMQSGTFQTTKISIRGIGSRSPYSTNRMRAFLDDIPLTTGDGSTVIDDIELTFIDKIEITKGPHSAWYGSGMGGSLRFVSLMEPNKPFVTEAAVSLGSFGLEKYSGNVRIAKPAGFFNVGLARLVGDGYRQNSSFSRNSVFISGQNRKRNKLNYLFLYSDVNSLTPSSIDEQTFINSPSLAAANWLNVKGSKDYERFLGGVRLESPIGPRFKNIATLSGSSYDQYELRPFNILDDKAMSFNFQENVMYTHSLFSVSAGFEWLHENYFWRILQNNTLLEKQKSNEIRNQFNTYLSLETKLSSTILLSFSGNINSTRYQVFDLFLADGIDYSGSYFNKLFFSPKIGLNYSYSSNLSFYASAGQGFSNPTAEESLTSQGFLNTALRPEQGWTIDLGARGTAFANSLSYEVSAYSIFLNDLLVTKRISEEVFYGENAGKSVLKGIELELKYKPARYFQTLVSFSKSDNRFKEFISDNVNYTNKQLPGIPTMNVNMDLQTVLFKNLQLNAIYKYNGAQFLNDENSKQNKAWQTVNLRAGYTLEVFRKHNVQLIATINNLFNEKYASMILVNAPTFSNRPPRYFYPALPRNFLFTIKMQLI